MEARVLFCVSLIFLLAACGNNATGTDKRLGFGFEPGLVPGRDFVAGQLIVGVKEGMSPEGIKEAASSAGAQAVQEIEGTLVLEFPSEQAAVDAVPILLRRPEVAFIERNGYMRIPPQPGVPSPEKKRR